MPAKGWHVPGLKIGMRSLQVVKLCKGSLGMFAVDNNDGRGCK